MFLTPPSEEHLQFAYYESSLVVEFLVQRFGLDQLKAILRDLGEGVEINQAIERHTAPMAKIEKEFSGFARQRAENLAPGLDWEKPAFLARSTEKKPAGKSRTRTPGPVRTNADDFLSRYGISSNRSANALTEWIAAHPTNFYALTERAGRLIEQKKFQEAREPLQKLVELYPAQTGGDSAYALLAVAHRALSETNAERQVLTQLAERDDEAADAYLRLMELGAAAQDWAAVSLNAQRYLAVNPLVPAPYRFLAQAGERRGETSSAIAAYGALLQLDPPDPAETHFRLAQLLDRTGDPAARRHVLQALEEAPRYRAALQLLLEINKKSPPAKTNAEKTAVSFE
jgi:tetratricopeptide (TPR) repeat protein